jgi:ATP-dependent Clp protease ATP-binding subunit ClpC
LLGLVREGEGVGAQVLIGLGADLGSVRQRVVQILDRGGHSPGSRTSSRTTAIVGAGIGGIFEPALNESRRRGDVHVGMEHVLLAAFERPESLAAQVLASFGLTKAEVEQRITALRGEGEQATPE